VGKKTVFKGVVCDGFSKFGFDRGCSQRLENLLEEEGKNGCS